ncbi:MAG TPA: V-type ATP synthase subunit C [Bacillota bacterium]|jgi:V/A-type H+-transporting ATPase subunit C|nr:V-type ATP synthase subunit C [Bacillota bacterium]
MPAVDRSYAYAYAVGRIRALERRLIDRNRFNRMIEAPSPEEVLKILAETDYAAAMAGLESVYDFEPALRDELGRSYLELKKMSPRPEIIDLFLLRFDIHNLKALFKARYLGTEAEMLYSFGTLSLPLLREAVAALDFRELPPRLRCAAAQVADEFALSSDSQAIDLILDRFLYDELVSSSREMGSHFLEEFFQKQVDLINIKTFIRLQRIGRDRAFLQKVLLPHGRLGPEFFIALYGNSLEQLAGELAAGEYGPLVGEGLRHWLERKSLARLEKLSDDFLTAFLQRGKHTPFGLEALVGYLWAREMEIKNIRLILVGKINRLPQEAIRERMRHAYL